jgi:hypothetical protein
MKRHQHDFRTLIETQNGYIGDCQNSIILKNGIPFLQSLKQPIYVRS